MARTKRPTRQQELAELLNARRALSDSVRGHLRDARDAEREKPLERSGEHVQPLDDIGLAMAHLHAQTLAKIDAALKRLAEGRYGNCADCGEPIAIERLRAVPFALRCVECEGARETTRPRRNQPTRLFEPDAGV